MPSRTTRTAPKAPALRLEALEAREVPAILIQVDYSFDASGFFANNPAARATMEQVAAELGNSLDANLAALTPSGTNTWTATFYNPATGGQATVPNLTVGANTIRVYVGARALTGSEAGFGGSGGYSISGSQAWINTVETRGHAGYSPWGGSITFDSRQPWYFGATAAGLGANQLDFYSVATHELGHVLGIGTSSQWSSLVQGGTFRGANATAVYGGPVPLAPDGDHWANGLTVGGQAVSLDPSLSYGQRVNWTALDAAALRDLGWASGAQASPPPAPAPNPAPTPTPPAVVPPGVVLVPWVGPNGTVIQYAIVNGAVFQVGRFTPFPGYRGPLTPALGDFDGDGVLDLAVAPAQRGRTIITILSGLDGHYIVLPRLTTGPLAGMLGADVDGDGRAELFTGEGTPMAIYAFNASAGALVPHTAYAAYGVPGRVALHSEADVNRTGYGDSLAGAPAAAPPQPGTTAGAADTPQPQPARLDGPNSGEATYTATAPPVKHQCTCPACRALAELLPPDTTSTLAPTAAPGDELLSTVRVG